MLQVPFIRNNQELVLEGLAKRNFVNAKEIIGRVLETDETRRNIQASLDNTLAESNAISKEIGLLFKTGQVQKAALAKEKSKKLKFIQERLKENGTDLYVLFAPGKGSYCSEYIPNKWKDKFNKHGTTNYKSYRNAFDRKKINYIDFNAWFLEMKETTPYPLFGKAGIHWSKYGEFLAADSLLQKIGEIRNAPMPDLVLDQITKEEKNRSGDYDIGEGMNLLFELPTFPMGYPQFHWDWDTSQKQQIVTFIADSYFWGMFNYGFSRDLFGDGEFWYYNKLIYPDSYITPLEVSTINIKEKAEENDVIILLSTDANLYKFAEGLEIGFKNSPSSQDIDESLQKYAEDI